MIYGSVQRQALVLSFIDAFWLLGVAFAIMIPLVLVMKGAKPHHAAAPSGAGH